MPERYILIDGLDVPVKQVPDKGFESLRAETSRDGWKYAGETIRSEEFYYYYSLYWEGKRDFRVISKEEYDSIILMQNLG